MQFFVKVKIKKCDHFCDELPLPSYETAMAAGCDVRACLGKGESLKIEPGSRILIPTGLAFEIPCGYEIQIRPRSGLSLKTGLMILNSPGTIDADYRGELKIIVGNLGKEAEMIHHGDRIAQMVVAPVIQASFEVHQELGTTQRGDGGFGSTGRS